MLNPHCGWLGVPCGKYKFNHYAMVHTRESLRHLHVKHHIIICYLLLNNRNHIWLLHTRLGLQFRLEIIVRTGREPTLSDSSGHSLGWAKSERSKAENGSGVQHVNNWNVEISRREKIRKKSEKKKEKKEKKKTQHTAHTHTHTHRVCSSSEHKKHRIISLFYVIIKPTIQ